jgi:FkbM family methyltransferase
MNEYIKNINFTKYNSVKLDIGLSYSAPHSQMWLENDTTGQLLVLGFEPNPDNVNSILKGNIIKRHIAHGSPINDKYINKQFFIIPVALSNIDIPTKSLFYSMEKDSGTSSLYKPTSQSLGKIKEIIEVPVYSLKNLFDIFPWDIIDRIDYIKIDAQGADFDIIKGAGDYLKDKVVYITAEPEASQYDGCSHNNVNNMDQYLKEQGFTRIKHKNTNDPTYLNNRFIHLANIIYIAQCG